MNRYRHRQGHTHGRILIGGEERRHALGEVVEGKHYGDQGARPHQVSCRGLVTNTHIVLAPLHLVRVKNVGKKPVDSEDEGDPSKK